MRSSGRGRIRWCGVWILTGAGDKAFCTGGDVKQRALTGDYGPTGNGLFEIDYLQRLMREIPKPVIAAVNGLAVGGGHVLQVLCDLSIAASTARFGQAGRRWVRSTRVLGTAYLRGWWGRSGRGSCGICAGCTVPMRWRRGGW